MLQERKRRHAERGDLVVDAAAPIPESRPESGADDGSDDDDNSASDSGSDRRRCVLLAGLRGTAPEHSDAGTKSACDAAHRVVACQCCPTMRCLARGS